MRKIILLLLLVQGSLAYAQELTVQKIMQDPKWIGTSPSGIFWSPDSRQIHFAWNPDGNISDSAYSASISDPHPAKAAYLVSAKATAESRGTYNSKRTQLVYSYENGLYLLDLKSGETVRVTRTAEGEWNPYFVGKDTRIVYSIGDNLFDWDIAHGTTEQLTDFVHTGEPAAPAQGRGNGSGRTGGGVSGGRGGGAPPASAENPQEQWLQREQTEWMQVVRERKDKREARQAYLKAEKDMDTLKVIPVGDKSVIGQTVSPDGRFVTYSLYQAPAGSKSTIVPQYVNESGFTGEIPGRTKVGAPMGKYAFFVYDRERDTVIEVKTDNIPGIKDLPDYKKDYATPDDAVDGPAGKTPKVRPVIIAAPHWNDDGSAVFVDIKSQDYKDRWIMQLDPLTGGLRLVDRQRDEAWVGGPGIGWLGGGSSEGWIDGQTIWFQSEASGYSHIYTYDLQQGVKKALTHGNYEVQQALLSHDKKFLYVLTNEEHPGKQSWYRLDVADGKTEKITSMTGQYEVTLSPDERWIAYRYSYINKPWELYIQENAPGKTPIQITNKAQTTEFSAYHWRDTRIFTIPSRDGKAIYARIYEPKPGTKNGAAVIFVHGAGYLQNVDYGWSYYFREYMFNNLLADKGYTVLDIDYRASSGYGRDWRTAIYRHMGGKDLDDEIDAAGYLVKEEGIDAKRIGMYGGSYGGFMTLMALFTQPGVFAAGAALRPVTDWAHYNEGYTAAILNEPYDDSLSYRRSSPIYFANGLKDHLLLCHGMVDENVHFQDDVRLVQRLIELGKDNWELAVYPMEDHGFVEPSSWTDEYKRILKLFDENLLAK